MTKRKGKARQAKIQHTQDHALKARMNENREARETMQSDESNTHGIIREPLENPFTIYKGKS